MFQSALLPLQQSDGYAATLTALGQPVERVESDAGHLLVVARKTPLGTARAAFMGPIWRSDDPAARQDLMRRARVHLVNPLGPACHVLRRRRVQLVTPGHHAILDLAGDIASRLDAKWRNGWRKCQKSDIRITAHPFEIERDSWILALDHAHQIAAGFGGYPQAFTDAYARCNPGHVMTYTAWQGRSPVGAMIFLLHAPTATYHIGWSGAEGRAVNAHNGLLMQAAQDFATQGIATLDLGQIDTRRAPGLARFKWGTGAEIRANGGTWLGWH